MGQAFEDLLRYEGEPIDKEVQKSVSSDPNKEVVIIKEANEEDEFIVTRWKKKKTL